MQCALVVNALELGSEVLSFNHGLGVTVTRAAVEVSPTEPNWNYFLVGTHRFVL